LTDRLSLQIGEPWQPILTRTGVYRGHQILYTQPDLVQRKEGYFGPQTQTPVRAYLRTLRCLLQTVSLESRAGNVSKRISTGDFRLGTSVGENAASLAVPSELLVL
jgi:hypothetical protein